MYFILPKSLCTVSNIPSFFRLLCICITGITQFLGMNRHLKLQNVLHHSWFSSSQWFTRHQDSNIFGSSGIARPSGTWWKLITMTTPTTGIMNSKNTQSHTKFSFIWFKNLKFDKHEKQTFSFKICILSLLGPCPPWQPYTPPTSYETAWSTQQL